MLALLEKALNEMKLAIIILDSSKRIIYMNQYANTLFKDNPNDNGEDVGFLSTDAELDKLKRGEKVLYQGKALLPLWNSISIDKKCFTVFYFEDCTHEDELEELNYCFSTILNSINEGVLLADANGTIRFYNTQLKYFEGLNPNKILGKSITEVYEVNAANSEHHTVLKTMSPIIDRYQKYQTLEDKEVHLIASTYPILRNGKIIFTYSISRNMAKIKELLESTQLLQNHFSPIIENSVADTVKNNTRYTLDSIIGKSLKIMSVIEKARRAAQISCPILICGETGTGKELFVQGIHNENSITKHQPFIPINCAAIPESLLESLLFGTVQGAFTGSKNTTGLIEQAGHGTLFLDEINSMPIGLQSKLLRVLQENKYRKLGGKEELPVYCRIISSTNIDPFECLEKSIIRKDLYYRLSVITLTVPPLRERREDIPILINHFIKLFSMKYGKPMISISKSLETDFLKYDWPGNIRELEHVIESSVTMINDEDTIMPKHVPIDLISAIQTPNEKKDFETTPLSKILLETEKKTILNVLEEYNWNISKSAAALEISRQNLQYRMHKLTVSRREKAKR